VETLSLVGTLAANEMVEIRPEIDGIVESIHFQEGERVKQGELLLELDRSKLAAGLAEAEANAQLSEANYERARQLLLDQLISQQEFDQTAATYEFNRASLELRRRQLRDTRLVAPFEGVVGARTVSPGQVITRGTIITWLIDLDTMKVELNVPERFLGQIQTGQRVAFTVAAYPRERFEGEVYFVSPHVDLETHTVLIKAALSNPRHLLRSGMFAGLDLVLTLREDSLVIPETALARLLENNRASVYVVGADQAADPREVELGVQLVGAVEILDGLREGEKVIVEGLQKIGPGSKVSPAPPEAVRPNRTTGSSP
jgi:membrane fusion protein (multidrug efflux system)